MKKEQYFLLKFKVILQEDDSELIVDCFDYNQTIYISSVNCFTQKEFEIWNKISTTNIICHVGEYNDDLEDELSKSYKNMKDLIDSEIVVIAIVDQSFYEVFHKNALYELSQTNIFDIESLNMGIQGYVN